MELLIEHQVGVAKEEYVVPILDDDYWGKPVPNMGRVTKRDPAPILIVGLAPGAHGANRMPPPEPGSTGYWRRLSASAGDRGSPRWADPCR